MYKKLIIIAREPNPYMIDLFNAFRTDSQYQIFVLFTTLKVWSSSHDFREFPVQTYPNATCKGKGIFGILYSCLRVLQCVKLLNKRVFVFFNGYGTIPNLVGIFFCFLFRKRFALWADHFDTRKPKLLPFISNILKKKIVQFVLNNVQFLCVSGKGNIDIARKYADINSRIINFPYVIDYERFANSIDDKLTIVNEIKEKAQNRMIFFFSGRLFKRKGLNILLKAIAAQYSFKEEIVPDCRR